MANNIGIKDGADADIVVKSTDNAAVHTPHHNIDVIAAGDNNIGNVDVVTLPALPAGSNNIGDVDVLTLPALPAGSNNIGDVDVLTLPALPAGSNNIGDVDIVSSIPGTGATNLGKAVSSAAGATDTGVAALVLRDDALTTLAEADAEYTQLRVTSLGALHTTDTNSAAALTALQLIDDPVFTQDSAFNISTSKVMVSGGVYQATPNALDDGDAGAILLDSSGRLVVAPGTAETVLGTTTYTEATTTGVVIAAVRRDADTTLANTTNEMAPLQLNANGALKVEVFDGGDSHTVDNAGTFPVQPQPTTSGGLAISRDIDLDNSTLTVVKASAGQLYGWTITNTTTAIVYVKFYNATSGTLGTGTPVLTIGIPGNATDDTTMAQSFGGLGIEFSTGICVGAGTGVADADNTDPGTNGVVANIYYK